MTTHTRNLNANWILKAIPRILAVWYGFLSILLIIVIGVGISIALNNVIGDGFMMSVLMVLIAVVVVFYSFIDRNSHWNLAIASMVTYRRGVYSFVCIGRSDLWLRDKFYQ